MTATVADQLMIEALPLDVQGAIRRLYGAQHGSVAPNGFYTEEDMAEAYEAGFEDAADQMERPYHSSFEFERWLNSR